MKTKQLIRFGAEFAAALNDHDTTGQVLDQFKETAKHLLPSDRNALRPIMVAALKDLGWAHATAYRKVQKVLGAAKATRSDKGSSKLTLTVAVKDIQSRIEAAVKKLAKGDKELAATIHASIIAKLAK